MSLLSSANMKAKLTREEYDQVLPKLQKEIAQLEFRIYEERIPVVILYEGWDAGGKGGNIRRLTERLDPRGYTVVPIAAPDGVERKHHYLWRFWNHIPKAGHIAIFDRTWYGRVLVERIEGFCKPEAWKRAYREINQFEEQIAHYGTVICKFWIHITKDEQLRRFQERQRLTHKKWKITAEDWRNRKRWPQYERAVSDMLAKTNTHYAPWTVVEGNDKLFARVKTLRTVIAAIHKALDKKD